jgi:hypothetical protein
LWPGSTSSTTLSAGRAATVRACAAVPSEWLDYLHPERSRELGRAAQRLPSVVYWWSSGCSFAEIGRHLSLFCGDWVAQRALDAALECIAARLNDTNRPPLRLLD